MSHSQRFQVGYVSVYYKNWLWKVCVWNMGISIAWIKLDCFALLAASMTPSSAVCAVLGRGFIDRLCFTLSTSYWKVTLFLWTRTYSWQVIYKIVKEIFRFYLVWECYANFPKHRLYQKLFYTEVNFTVRSLPSWILFWKSSTHFVQGTAQQFRHRCICSTGFRVVYRIFPNLVESRFSILRLLRLAR